MIGPYPVTGRQLDVLRFIVGYQQAHGGVSPTLDEIGRGLGLTHRSGVLRLLDCLEERGRIRRLPRRQQAIEVIAPVPVPCAPDGAPLYFVPVPAQPHGRDASLQERTAAHG